MCCKPAVSTEEIDLCVMLVTGTNSQRSKREALTYSKMEVMTFEWDLSRPLSGEEAAQTKAEECRKWGVSVGGVELLGGKAGETGWWDDIFRKLSRLGTCFGRPAGSCI